MSEALRTTPTDVDADQVEVLDQAAALAPYSDGRVWEPQLVARETLAYLEQGMLCFYEVGRRLIWTKRVLGHGAFEDWVEKNLNLSARAARQYMQVADFLTENPRLLQPAAKAGIKKMLLLATLAPDQIDQLFDGGGVPSAEIPDIETIPYYELKQRVDALTKGGEKDRQRAAQAEQERDKLKAELADLVRPGVAKDEEQLRAQLDKAVAGLEKASGLLAYVLDQIAGRRRNQECSDKLLAHGHAAALFAERLASLERLNFTAASGEMVAGVEYADILEDTRPLANVYRLPTDRVPRTFGE